MIFWVAAVLLAALTSWLTVSQAVRRATAAVHEPNFAAEVYRRQFDEISELADAGLLGQDERGAALAEAGRRLLAAKSGTEAPPPSSPVSPRLLVAGLALVLLVTLALYFALGRPGRPDEPFSHRLAQWRAEDLRTLDAPKVAALLTEVAKTTPDDSRLQLYLGRARLQAGDYFGAADSFRRATRLIPTDAEAYRLLGEALFQTTPDGPPPPEAETAMARAVQLNPQDAAARYFLAEAAFRRGDLTAARQGWTRARDLLPAEDARRDFLDDRIREADRLAAGPGMSPEAITGMVSGLAERLRSNPDDPQGWARLVRSYGVLGKKAEQQRALAAARQALVGRPAELAKVEAEAMLGQPSPR